MKTFPRNNQQDGPEMGLDQNVKDQPQMDMAKQDQAYLERPTGGVIPGVGELSPRDISAPRVVIVQPTSTMVGATEHIGQYHNTATGEFIPVLKAVFCGVKTARISFPENYDPDVATILCASSDGQMPDPEYIGETVKGVQITGGPCTECPLSEFGEDEQGRPIRPGCDLMYVYAAFDVETHMPFTFSVRGSGMPEGRKLNYLLSMYGFTSYFELRTQKRAGPRGAFFIPQVKLGGVTPRDLFDTIDRSIESISRMAKPDFPTHD